MSLAIHLLAIAGIIIHSFALDAIIRAEEGGTSKAGAVEGRSILRAEPAARRFIAMRSDGGMVYAEQHQKVHSTEDEKAALVQDRAIAHPVLPKPFFWFWGRAASIITDDSLLQDAPLIVPPSAEAYNLKAGTGAASYAQWKQDLILKPILGNVQKGFFVESGALDGELCSNTLLYELEGWSGLLVEPDPKYFPQIGQKHRHAYAYNGCLSPTGNAETIRFSQSPVAGLSSASGQVAGSSITVKAQPLHVLMEAIGRNVVDFWSLDIEGSEAPVLRTTDFSKVEVGVLLIEMNKSEENNKGIRDVMQQNGFRAIGHSNYDGGILDHIFINPKYFQSRNLAVPTREVLEEQYRD